MKVTMPELSRSQYETLIFEWIHSERDRELMKRRLLDGVTYEKLAEEFEISVPQAKRIVYRATETLLRHAG